MKNNSSEALNAALEKIEQMEHEVVNAQARVRELEGELKEATEQASEDKAKWQFYAAENQGLLTKLRRLEQAQPPAPTYLDRPDKPGWWWFCLEEYHKWTPLECFIRDNDFWVDEGEDQYPASAYGVGKWIPLPATPPPPPAHRSSELAHARLKGAQDAREGVTIPPPDYCEETMPSKMLREAWLEGWHSVSNTTPPPPPAKEEKE